MGAAEGKEIDDSNHQKMAWEQKIKEKDRQLVEHCFIRRVKGSLVIHEYIFNPTWEWQNTIRERSLIRKTARVEKRLPLIIDHVKVKEKELREQALIKIGLQGCSIGDQSCEYLSRLDFYNDFELDLQKNRINADDCEILCRNKWQNIRSLNLGSNFIGDKGCSFLAQSQWPNLKELNLKENIIEAKGCLELMTANWDLTALVLDWNKIGPDGSKCLVNRKCTFFKQCSLYCCKISTQGCQILTKLQWIYLEQLDLGTSLFFLSQNQEQIFERANMIGDKGCILLERCQWMNLRNLNLEKNGVKEEGCQYICSFQGLHLKQINLNKNRINDRGCKFLSKGFWPELQGIFLVDNIVGEKGCSYLKKAQWQSLTKIHLGNPVRTDYTHARIFHNRVGDRGCQWLSKAKWQKLSQLKLREDKEGSSNGIREKGCEGLAKLESRVLQKFLLQENPIGEQGYRYLTGRGRYICCDQIYKKK